MRATIAGIAGATLLLVLRRSLPPRERGYRCC